MIYFGFELYNSSVRMLRQWRCFCLFSYRWNLYFPKASREEDAIYSDWYLSDHFWNNARQVNLRQLKSTTIFASQLKAQCCTDAISQTQPNSSKKTKIVTHVGFLQLVSKQIKHSNKMMTIHDDFNNPSTQQDDEWCIIESIANLRNPWLRALDLFTSRMNKSPSVEKTMCCCLSIYQRQSNTCDIQRWQLTI